MKTLFLPLVDWGMGTFLIGVFAFVCIILVAVIYSLSRSKDIVPEHKDETHEKNMEL